MTDSAADEAASSAAEVAREAALRQRLVDARKGKQRQEDDTQGGHEPEAKRQKIRDGSLDAVAPAARLQASWQEIGETRRAREPLGAQEGHQRATSQAAQDAHEAPRDQRRATTSDAQTPTVPPAKPAQIPQLWSGLRRSAHPPITTSRSIYTYERLNHIQEGTYGIVFRARAREPLPSSSSSTSSCFTTSSPSNPPTPSSAAAPTVVAVKKLKLSPTSSSSSGFPITALREIHTLFLSRTLPHIVRLHEVCVGKTLDQIFLVMEFMEHDLKSLLGYKRFAMSEVKTIMYQLLEGVEGLHREWVVHRDLKGSNLLMDNRGGVKLGDFGLARKCGEPSTQGGRGGVRGGVGKVDGGMTDLVVTLWYRAPELLLLNHVMQARDDTSSSSAQRNAISRSKLYQLHSKSPSAPLELPIYDAKIDMWSVGCIMAELLSPTGTGLFQGSDEPDQLRRIQRVLGQYTTTNWPDVMLWQGLPHHHRPPSATPSEIHQEQRQRKASLQAAFHPNTLSEATLDLLFQLLQWDPKQRVSAEDALKHRWFWDEKPSMAHPESFGSFPSVAAGEKVAEAARVRDEPCAPDVRAKKRGAEDKYPMEFDFA